MSCQTPTTVAQPTAAETRPRLVARFTNEPRKRRRTLRRRRGAGGGAPPGAVTAGRATPNGAPRKARSRSRGLSAAPPPLRGEEGEKPASGEVGESEVRGADDTGVGAGRLPWDGPASDTEAEDARLAEFLALSDDDVEPEAAAVPGCYAAARGAQEPGDLWSRLLPADSDEAPAGDCAGDRRPPSPLPCPLPIAPPEQPIPGLLVFRDLLPRRCQLRLLAGLKDTGHFAGRAVDQGVRFGPAHPKLEWFDRWLENALAPFLAHLGKERLAPPFFNHAIANLYRPGQGIRSHVDLTRFTDGVVGVSLVGECGMVFRPIPGVAPARGSEEKALRLRPGDVYCLTGESRYSWTHGIRSEDMPGWRVSLTLRKLVPGWEEGCVAE